MDTSIDQLSLGDQQPKGNRFRIFLSSFSSENPDEEGHLPGSLRVLRRAAYDLDRDAVWVAEHWTDAGKEPGFRQLAMTDPLRVTDTLIERVRQSDEFVCVLAGSRRGDKEHGSPINIDGRPSAVSHFEIELFQAALRQKPIHLFVLEGFDPGPRLKKLLDLLSFALGDWKKKQRQTDSQIVEAIRRLLNKKPHSASPSIFRDMVESFYRVRGLSSKNGLLFLDGAHEACELDRSPDETIIHRLLTEHDKSPEMQRKLSRLWIAAREMMALESTSKTSIDDPSLLILWNRILGSWWSAAAWSGLHAHISVGTVAALNSQAIIRERLRKLNPSELGESELIPPDGALASAYYSIAKQLFWPWRSHCFNRSMEFVNQVIERDPISDPNIYAVRGSISFQRWNPWRAVEDYKKVLKLRELRGDKGTELGSSISELGFALWFCGKFNEGESLMKKGIQLMEEQGESGYLLRGYRKLMMAYKFSFRRTKALGIKEKIQMIGNRLAMDDQTRQIQ